MFAPVDISSMTLDELEPVFRSEDLGDATDVGAIVWTVPGADVAVEFGSGMGTLRPRRVEGARFDVEMRSLEVVRLAVGLLREQRHGGAA